jgi:hypothetical protein
METNNIKIKLTDLKKIIKSLFNELNKLDDNTAFSLDEDFYWNILDEELYAVYKDPKELTMGRLFDDWEFLGKVVNNDREIIDYDLYKLAAILKFLGKKGIIGKIHNSDG